MQAEFNPQKGSIAFYTPGMGRKCLLEGIPTLIYQLEYGSNQQANLADSRCLIGEEGITDQHGNGRQLVLRAQVNPQGIELTYRINTYKNQEFTLLQLEVRNLSCLPIHLEEFCLFSAEPAYGGRVGLPESHGELRFFKAGWHGWDYTGLRSRYDRNAHTWLDALTSTSYANPVTRRSSSKGVFSSEGWGVLSDNHSSLVVGFITTARQFGQVYANLRPGKVDLRLSTQADGFLLDPGETCASEWAYLQLVPLPKQQPAIDFIEALGRQMNARLSATPPPPMWTHWYHFYHNISEELFLENLDALLEQQGKIPIKIVELDDGYQSSWGDWTLTNSRFPHGLEWLADQISAKGFAPGLWLAPFQVQPKSMVAREHPDWLLKDNHGKPIHAGFQYNLFVQALDGTHPAVLEHFRDLMDLVCQRWGFGMVKLDFLNAGALPGKRYDPKKTRAEALRMGLEALRQGAGDTTFLLASGCPFGPAIGIVDAMRIGPDTAPSWEPYFHWIPWAGPLIKKEPSMPSLRNALRHTLNLSLLHKRLWWNDPDCLLVRDRQSKLTMHEVQSAVTLVGLSGGMLVSSDDLRNLNPSRANWIAQLMPNLELRGEPLDWLEHEMNRVFRAEVKQAGQVWQLVGIFNWGETTEDFSLNFDLLGYLPGTRLHSFERWSDAYWLTGDRHLLLRQIPPHGCKLLRICEARQTPQLVADTLHISQGGEIASWEVKEDRLNLETIEMGRMVEGELWLALDTAPRKTHCNGEAVKVEDRGNGIYALLLKVISKARVEVEI